EVVRTRMSVKNGRISLPDGMSYRLLVLSDSKMMTPQLLSRLQDLVRAGATVIGPKPERSPSLSDFPDCDQTVSEEAAELWGNCDGQLVKEHRYGKGRIFWGRSPFEVLEADGVPPDFTSRSRHSEPIIRYTHRLLDEIDIYFLANKSPEPEDVVCA